uniref:ROK N-terminal domain-containing protein n=1 Tax=Salvator merianae TaxID=96440 RepID=A0A8D0BRS6_SALMN
METSIGEDTFANAETNGEHPAVDPEEEQVIKRSRTTKGVVEWCILLQNLAGFIIGKRGQRIKPIWHESGPSIKIDECL